MPVTYKGFGGGNNNGTSISFSYNAGTNDGRYMLSESRSAAGSRTSATYAGAAFVQISGAMAMELNPPAPGTNTASFTFTDSYAGIVAIVTSFEGVDPANPRGARTASSGNSTTRTLPSITCPVDGMVVSYGEHNGTNGAEAAVSGTLSGFHDSSGNYRLFTMRRSTTGTLVSNGGSYTTNWGVEGWPLNPLADANIPHKLNLISQAIQRGVM